jgi:outer membrane receptor for ferric coprogen and ferric-rhodotorulic acid
MLTSACWSSRQQRKLLGTHGRAALLSAVIFPHITSGQEITTDIPAIIVTADDSITEQTDAYKIDKMSTATGLKLTPRHTPQSVSVVTRQQIEDQNLLDTAAIVSSAAGISASRSDSNRYAFSSRGFSIDNFQFDGLSSPILAQWNYGTTDLDSAIYDHVEIVRGATGLMTGSGNPSAAVNFIRKRPLQEFAASSSFAATRWNGYRGDLDISTPLDRDGNFRTRVVGAYSDGDSYVTDLDNRKRSLYGIIESDVGSTTLLKAGVEYQHNTSHGFGSGFPLFYSDGSRTDFGRSASNNAPWAFLDTESTTIFLDLTHRFGGDWKLRTAYSYNDGNYQMKQIYRGGYPNRDTGLGMTSSFSNYDGERYRNDIHLALDGTFSVLGFSHELALGWMQVDDHSNIRQYLQTGTRPAINSYFEWPNNTIAEPSWSSTLTPADDLRTKQNGGFVVGRFSLATPVYLIIGSRLSNWETDQTYFGAVRKYQHNDVFTPYAGLLYDFNDRYTAYASYTEIFQPQNTRNPDGSILDPITGQSFEAGLKGSHRDGKLNTAIALYRTRQDNLAEAITGQEVTGMPGTQAYRAVSGATVEGFELEANGEIVPGWNLAVSYTHFVAKDANGDAINTNHPRTMFKLFSSYRIQQLTVGGGIDWQSRIHQLASSPNGNVDVSQGGYALVNLMARYMLTPKLSASLNLNNVFDKQYYSQIGFYSQGWWGTPRNATLSLQLKF